MLTHAFLAVMTATARAETPSEQGLIALTASEIRHLFTRLVNHTRTASGTCCTGHDGDAVTKPAHATATTAVRPDFGHPLRIRRGARC